MLHVVALVGDTKISIQARAHAAVAVRRFVDVDDLRLLRAAAFALQIPEGELSRRLGADGVHGRVDLHSRGDTDGNGLLPQRFIDVARGAVAAGEEQKVRPLHRAGSADGVVGCRLSLAAVNDLHVGEAELSRQRLAHLSACAEHAEVVFHRQELRQGFFRAVSGMTDGAEAGSFRCHAVCAL